MANTTLPDPFECKSVLPEIHVDTRESIAADLRDFALRITVRPLDVGDFLFVGPDGAPLWIVERKTPEDLYASIRDGRYRSQKQRMVEFMAPHGGAARVLYLIEGLILPGGLSKGAKKGPKISGNAAMADPAMGAIVNTLVRDGIGMTCVAPGTVALFLAKMARCIATYGVAVPWAADSARETAAVLAPLKRGRVLRPDTALTTMLSTIPGVSVKTAAVIAAKYGSMAALIAAYGECEDDAARRSLLAGVLMAKRRIGPKISGAVFSFLFAKELAGENAKGGPESCD